MPPTSAALSSMARRQVSGAASWSASPPWPADAGSESPSWWRITGRRNLGQRPAADARLVPGTSGGPREAIRTTHPPRPSAKPTCSSQAAITSSGVLPSLCSEQSVLAPSCDRRGLWETRPRERAADRLLRLGPAEAPAALRGVHGFGDARAQVAQLAAADPRGVLTDGGRVGGLVGPGVGQHMRRAGSVGARSRRSGEAPARGPGAAGEGVRRRGRRRASVEVVRAVGGEHAHDRHALRVELHVALPFGHEVELGHPQLVVRPRALRDVGDRGARPRRLAPRRPAVTAHRDRQGAEGRPHVSAGRRSGPPGSGAPRRRPGKGRLRPSLRSPEGPGPGAGAVAGETPARSSGGERDAPVGDVGHRSDRRPGPRAGSSTPKLTRRAGGRVRINSQSRRDLRHIGSATLVQGPEAELHPLHSPHGVEWLRCVLHHIADEVLSLGAEAVAVAFVFGTRAQVSRKSMVCGELGFQAGFGVFARCCVQHSVRPVATEPSVPATWNVTRSSRRTRTAWEELICAITPPSSPKGGVGRVVGVRAVALAASRRRGMWVAPVWDPARTGRDESRGRQGQWRGVSRMMPPPCSAR